MDVQQQRASSTAALEDMRSSNSSLREKFGKFRGKSEPKVTEYQRKYMPQQFDPIRSRKDIRPSSRSKHYSKKVSQRKTRQVIDAELTSPSPSTSSSAQLTRETEKENSHQSNSVPDNFSDAPSASSFSTKSVCGSGISLQEKYSESASEEQGQVQANGTEKEEQSNTTSSSSHTSQTKRMSETTAEYIRWPLQEHVVHHGPMDHEMIANPNTTSSSCNWQSVQKEEMQVTAELLAASDESARGEISATMYDRAHSLNTPRFFAWRGATEKEVKKRVLTFENSHSEYRDCYTKKDASYVQPRRLLPPKDHEMFGKENVEDVEEKWRSTAQLQMDVSEKARLDLDDTLDTTSPAGLSSDVLAQHTTGRKSVPTPPVFFAWQGPKVTPHEEPVTRTQGPREQVHTESSDNYVIFNAPKVKRVPPPTDHRILDDVTDHPSPVIYQSLAQEQMEDAARKSAEGAVMNDVSGSTSEFLKKDYRKSYAPGYFAWPVVQQFAETTQESRNNVHTEYRDNFVENNVEEHRLEDPPRDHNVLGSCEQNVDSDTWKSAAKTQMTTIDNCNSSSNNQVAGASSAFLAKDLNNLCPPGYFAWPVAPPAAKKKIRQSQANVHSEYKDNYVGTVQPQQRSSPPKDNGVFEGSVDAVDPAQWQSVATSQMIAARENSSPSANEDLSLEAAARDYRKSFAPGYFAWPVKNQRAERTTKARENVHTEYRDQFVQDPSAETVRVPPPEDHIVLGDDIDATQWKTIASLQSEQSNACDKNNGEDVVFKARDNSSSSSTPNFFVWPKKQPTASTTKDSESSKRYGYGGEISSEYDSKYIEMDVKNLHVSPIKITQTIPINEVDESVWKSTTKRDMEISLAAQETERSSNIKEETAGGHEDKKPMNFAWKPLPDREKREKNKPTKKTGPPLSTEHRLSFVDWTPKVQEINEHHLAEAASTTNTAVPKKRRDVKFSGMSETQSRFKAWSPILSKHKSCHPPVSVQSEDSVYEQDMHSDGVTEDVKSLTTAASSSIAPEEFSRTSHRSEDRSTEVSRTSQQRSRDHSGAGGCSRPSRRSGEWMSGGETVDSALFSTDSLDQRSSAGSSSASSRKWFPHDDANLRRNASQLGLRQMNLGDNRRCRSMSAPTRRRPLNSHLETDRVNPILRNYRFPSTAQPRTAWTTEMSSEYTWK